MTQLKTSKNSHKKNVSQTQFSKQEIVPSPLAKNQSLISLDLPKLKNSPNQALTTREVSPEKPVTMTITPRLGNNKGSRTERLQKSKAPKNESPSPAQPTANKKSYPLSPKLNQILSHRLKTSSDEKSKKDMATTTLKVNPFSSPKSKGNVSISEGIGLNSISTTDDLTTSTLSNLKASISSSKSQEQKISENQGTLKTEEDCTIEKNEAREKTTEPKIRIKKIQVEQKPFMRFGKSNWNPNLLLSLRENDSKCQEIATSTPLKNLQTPKQKGTEQNQVQQVSKLDPQQNEDFSQPVIVKNVFDFSLKNSINMEDQKPFSHSARSSKKSSIDQLESSSTSQDDEEKIVVPALKLNLVSVEDDIPKLTISKKCVTFSENVISEFSIEEPNFNVSEGIQKPESIIKRSGFERKAQKPAETFSESVEALSAVHNRVNSHGRLDIFSNTNGVNFFDFNESNPIFGSDSCLNVNNIIRSSRRTKTQYQAPDGTAPMVISYLGDNGTLAIQPKFMEKHGSMCFTELWSGKAKADYLTKRSKDIAVTKKVATSDSDTLYRPDKDIKKGAVQARIMANKAEATPSCRNSDVYRLPLISERSPTHRDFGCESPSLRGVKDAPLRDNLEARSVKSLFSKQTSLFM